MINVETVSQARLLQGSVGYVRLSQFSPHTTRDLVTALNAQKAEAGGHLDGIVLDLRNNPGGLLDQAIQVSDLFLSEGVIEKTVAHADKETFTAQEVKEAHADPTDIINVPLVLIVNSNSASASEIVAGALKNNNRALVIGRQTFGKGSVQVLQDVNDPDQNDQDPPTLKLTIAQYLTPGDVSIQETGITPDVLLMPGRALKEQVNVFAPPRSTREADLEHHFSNLVTDRAAPPAPGDALPRARPRRPRKSALELHYLLDEKEDEVARQLRKEAAAAAGTQPSTELTPEEQEDEESEADPDAFVEDYEYPGSRRTWCGAPPSAYDRPHLLEAARDAGDRAVLRGAGAAREAAQGPGHRLVGRVRSGTPRAVAAGSRPRPIETPAPATP